MKTRREIDKQIRAYQKDSHPAWKVAVSNRQGTFYLEYNQPLLKSGRVVISLRIKVDASLLKSSTINPDWWISSKHRDLITRGIIDCREKRDLDICNFLEEQFQLTKAERHARFAKIIKYLLLKDPEIIAYSTMQFIGHSGVEAILSTIPIQDLKTLATNYHRRQNAIRYGIDGEILFSRRSTPSKRRKKGKKSPTLRDIT